MQLLFNFNQTGKPLNDDTFSWNELPKVEELEHVNENYYFYYATVYAKLRTKSNIVTPIKINFNNIPIKVTPTFLKMLYHIKDNFEKYDDLFEINCHLSKPIIKIYKNTDNVLNTMFNPEELKCLINNENSCYHKKSQGFKVENNSIIAVFKPEIDKECNKKLNEILNCFAKELINEYKKLFNSY